MENNFLFKGIQLPHVHRHKDNFVFNATNIYSSLVEFGWVLSCGQVLCIREKQFEYNYSMEQMHKKELTNNHLNCIHNKILL